MDENNENKTSEVEKRDEFDIVLGGDVLLPPSFSVKNFVNSRINEIEALSEAIENPQRTAMIFQQLPKRMRRRVMSHNAKRMPNSLKLAHTQLLDKCGAREVGKRPCRKYRRRPKNLREDYARRQRTNTWLETHIWHAKRFHMTNTWGYRLANFPNDKSYRACYRASSQHCLLQDVSFMCCIEMFGSVEEIIKGLSNLSDDSFKKKPQLSGFREGTAVIKHSTGSPIGEVTYMWNGVVDLNDIRQLWIWSHPAFYLELYEQIQCVFKATQVKVTSLKDQLVRFRLTGPKSIEVLTSGLKFIKDDEMTGWTSDYYSDISRLENLKIQSDYYSKFRVTSNPGQLPPRSIQPAVVTTSMPTIPYLMREREIDVNQILEKPVESVNSPLWSPELRQAMKIANEEAKELAKKANKLVPSLEKTPVDRTPVAVILIHREGRQSDYRGYGCGLDLICPAGWGMRIWLCLVHHGGRVCGLRESTLVESNASLKPSFVLNSNASEENIRVKSLNSRERHFKLPPAKRPNYQKLGALNPFDLPWDLLKEEWTSNDLIRVSIVTDGKLCSSSHICLPIRSDLENCGQPPVEPPHSDVNKVKRDELRRKHRANIKKLAKERKKFRLKSSPKDTLPSSKAVVDENKLAMEKLWLGEVNSVRNHCSRQIMGFVTEGQFSYLHGKCAGYGYVASLAFEELKKVQTNVDNNYLVLSRTTNSLQYRFATITIV